MICKCDYLLSDIIIILIPRITCRPTIGRTFLGEIVNKNKKKKKKLEVVLISVKTLQTQTIIMKCIS